ncbi:hypothetical protein [Sphingomonas aquatilis]|uniref:hypothetical protein n=1 Tax=Sphingomonas aquatilis TaxID=93063 RepID=UPI001FBBD92B|nr:hypothetical protein [Sphingomonas aquatilis]GKS02844.1 hypothetical protein Aug2020_05740 [Sphingomonas aquatilis]
MGTERSTADANERREAAGALIAQGKRPTKQWARWNAAMRDTFFAHLAGSCNIAASAAAIGLSPSQVQHRRRTNPQFAALWADAIEAGYQLLEMRLLGYALAGGGETIAPDDPNALGPVHWEGAIKLLTIHRARREGRGKPCGPAPKAAPREETDAAIVAGLAALAARRTRALLPMGGA